jgi:hypothetical protein
MKRLLVLALVLAPLAPRADEGMWTFDAFPSDKVQAKYGFGPSAAWLENARLASVRLAGGCSASFVSPDGLVLTNHHCVHDCVEQLSTAERDLVKDGFLARARADERRCPAMEVNQLVKITDVTAEVRAATKGLSGEAFAKAERAATARLEQACQRSDALRCDVVTLYQGGLYHLYEYRRHQDVRLVFAPEFQIAFFGGDPDNFMFPRYDLDVAFIRVYEGDRPLQSKHHFRWSAGGAAEGELTFVSGHPGGTDRALTTAQLALQRDVVLPDRLARTAELRGLLTGFQLLGPEQKRISSSLLFYTENSFKVYRGRLAALQDREFFRALAAREEALKASIAQDPARAREVLPAFDAIAKAQDRARAIRDAYNFLEAGFRGQLFPIGRMLVRGAAERAKPNGERLEEYRDSALAATTQELFSEAPVYPELEVLLLAHSLDKIRERLGPDHAAVKALLGKESPQEVAARAVQETKLRDVAARRALWDGGAAAVAASRDPLVLLARSVDDAARAARKAFEDEVEAPVKQAHEKIASARFAAQGRALYPDATFTLRLSYGAVEGWKEDGREVKPFTTFAGAYERHTGRDPFALPPRWLEKRGALDLSTPFNFVTTNDIIGGNSGSPMVNRHAEIVGLVFDGNIHSLGGNYGFDPAVNRTVAVHSAGILAALTRVYGATELVNELRPAAKKKR